jgi:PAS domain S-box-containing protein
MATTLLRAATATPPLGGVAGCAEGRFGALVQSASEAIVHARQSGEVLYCNRSGERMMGRTAGDLVGRPLASLFVDPAKLEAAVALASLGPDAAGLGHTAELLVRRQDGSAVVAEVSFAAWSIESDRFVTAIMRDVTARREMALALYHAHESTLEIAHLQGERLDELRHAIVGSMSAMLGMAERALATRRTDEQRRCLQTIRDAAGDLLRVSWKPLPQARYRKPHAEWDADLTRTGGSSTVIVVPPPGVSSSIAVPPSRAV